MTMPPTPQWRKSSYSNGTGGECVEIVALATHVGVRDSKAPEGPRLSIPDAAWAGFITALRERRMN